jgi:acyl-coenzyme A thioesterase PaaI-like protein
MNIPFIENMGIEAKENGSLYLPFREGLLNHLGTIHASAQFTLAETQSGFYLELMFPQYGEGVVPLLRSSSVKYKHPAIKDIYSVARTSKEALDKFESELQKKGRAVITIDVWVYDSTDMLTMQGEFCWLISRM